MISRVFQAMSKVLVIDSRLRAAIHRSGRFFAHWGPRWARYKCMLKWVCMYGSLASLLLVTAVVLPLLGFLMFIGYLCYAKRQKTEDTEHGSARLATLKDLIWQGYLYTNSGLIIGRVLDGSGGGYQLAREVLWKYPKHLAEQAVRVSDGLWVGDAKNAAIILPNEEMIHASVYGRSGSGKSTSHAIPNLLIDWESSVVCTDVKSELAQASARHRADYFNQEIICVAPFGGVPDGFQQHAFNPLSVVNHASPHLLPDAIHFAKALIQPDKQDHNPFFIKSAILILDAVLSFLFSHAPASQCNLQKLREYTVDPDKLKYVAEFMLRSDFAGGYLRSKGKQLLALTGKTLNDVLSTLNTQMFWVDSLAVEQATCWTTFEMRRLLEGTQSIYFILPTDRASDFSSLLRVWITAIAHAIFKAGIERKAPIRFYFDEASLLGADMPVLERMLTKGRGYGMRTCWYWQSVHQIQEVFPDHMAQVFREQMSVEQFLEISNYQTAQEVSRWIGQTTVRVGNESHSTGWSRSDTQALHPSVSYGSSGNTSHGYQKSGRALLQPEELLQLPADVTIVLKPQCPPILARKIKSYLSRDYAELVSIPFGITPGVNAAKARRRGIVALVIGILMVLALMHPKEMSDFQTVAVAAWNKSYPNAGSSGKETKTTKSSKSTKKSSPRSKRQRVRRPVNYPYGY